MGLASAIFSDKRRWLKVIVLLLGLSAMSAWAVYRYPPEMSQYRKVLTWRAEPESNIGQRVELSKVPIVHVSRDGKKAVALIGRHYKTARIELVGLDRPAVSERYDVSGRLTGPDTIAVEKYYKDNGLRIYKLIVSVVALVLVLALFIVNFRLDFSSGVVFRPKTN